MSFTALVVLHDSEAHLRRLLASLEALPERPQVVCVDAASADEGPRVARAWGAEVLELGANPGFGAANDAGIALARSEVTVLLNPDTIAIGDGLARLAAVAAARPVLAVPRLLNPDGSLQRSAHPLPGTPGAALAALTVPRLLPRPLRERLEPFRARRPRTCGWAIAACLAARTSTLRALGPFDPDAFLFYEDLDLCLRARSGGTPTLFVPGVEVIHVGGHSTARHYGGEAFDVEARRRREVVGERLGAAALARDDRAQALTFALRAAAGRDRARNRALLAALRRARAG